MAIGLLSMLSPLGAFALSPDFYASTSKLAQGKWAKVEVAETGMQLISNATLKNLGFPDPDKVNVYGYGGQMLSERLDKSMPDDLPVVPSLRTPQGIVFFGNGNVSWKTSTNAKRTYEHTLNPYSNKSYYFISDIDEERAVAPKASLPANSNLSTITVFTERILHEKELLAPSNTGRELLGEDFRTQTLRTFPFDLPGNTGAATVTVVFGAKCGNKSLLSISANGTQLPYSASDDIAANNNSKSFLQKITTIKNAGEVGEKLSLAIQYNYSGALFTAALDYIEVEYPRQLKLTDNGLHFYLSPTSASEVVVDGCSESTIIWDVTDPLSIQNVDYILDGSRATFAMPKGYHEYVAFNPSKISRVATAAGKIQNQDIHGMEAPGMIIICPDVYRSAAQRLVELHAETDGLSVAVLSPEAIYNEFSSGSPEVTAFRKMLKMWYDRAAATGSDYTRYCLIMSRPTYDNKLDLPAVKNCGYPRVPIWQSKENYTENSFSTDDYIGMLADNNSTLNMSSAKIMVAVGRMPVKSVTEANNAVAKLEKYIKNPVLGSWRNNVMLIADDQDTGKHLTQAEESYAELISYGNGANFLYDKVYLDAYPLQYTGVGPAYPEAKQHILDKLAEGVIFFDYIGHANPKSWTHENLMIWSDFTGMTNTNLPFMYAATCEFMRWDADETSGAEEMWLNPTAGIIGAICPSRSVYVSANGDQNKYSCRYVFRKDADGNSLRVGDIMINGKNDIGYDNKLRYGLMGDPAMRLPSPANNVVVDAIGNTALDSAVDFPVIPARGTVKVSGRITDKDGNTLDDFNGTLDIQLYDAEKVIETYGNGEDGKVMLYNDRKTRLFTGRAKVTDGHWETTITMPSEIENNYSPALLSLYASDELRREANGGCEKFYVYGYDTSAPDDDQGPEISEFYLNSPSFVNGNVVSPSPIVMARFSDPSGINSSESGIGHGMSIALDGKVFYDDVVLHYSPSGDDPTAGSIVYPLSDIQPGEHTLTFTVWDNANNSSSSSLSFNVAAGWLPEISTLSTDVNPASTSVNFIIATDGALGTMDCKVDVYDLGGKLVWSGTAPSMTAGGTRVTLGWDLCDFSGARVGRGIYIYRATVTTPEGATITKSRKLAVTAQ